MIRIAALFMLYVFILPGCHPYPILPFQKASFLSRILDYDLPATYTKEQNELLEHLSLDELNKLASRYSPDPAKVNIVLVGDKARVWDKLQKLGYEMEELYKDGNPVK